MIVGVDVMVGVRVIVGDLVRVAVDVLVAVGTVIGVVVGVWVSVLVAVKLAVGVGDGDARNWNPPLQPANVKRITGSRYINM